MLEDEVGVPVEQQICLGIVAFCFVDLRLAGLARTRTRTRTRVWSTHLLLHGICGPQPICQRDVRIVCVIAGLRNQLSDTGRIAGGHGEL